MKTKLPVSAIVAVIILLGVMTSCTKDDPLPTVSSSEATASNLYGTWHYDAQTYAGQRFNLTSDIYWSLGENGSFLEYGDQTYESGTYEYLNNNIWIHSPGYNGAGWFKVSKLTQTSLILTLEGGNDQTMIFSRKQSTIVVNYPTLIIGKWQVQGDAENRVWEMRDDGTMTYTSENTTVQGTYEISGATLTIDCSLIHQDFTILFMSNLSMMVLYKDGQETKYYRFIRVTDGK